MQMGAMDRMRIKKGEKALLNSRLPSVLLLCLLHCIVLTCFHGQAATGGLLHLGEGSRMLIPAGAYVSVRGPVITGDDPERLILFVTDSAAASLLHMANAQATIYRFFSSPAYTWYGISSPVTQQEVVPDFSGEGASLITYYELAQTWVNASNQRVWPTWSDANEGKDILLPLKGYQAGFAHNMPDYALRYFAGPLNHGSQDIILSRSAHPSDPYVGWNLLGNPYVSAIDWYAEDGWTGLDCLQGGGAGKGVSMWRWNENAGNYGVAHTQAFFRGHNKNNGLIAPLEAFWVRVASGSQGCVFSVHEQARRHAAPVAEKAGPVSDKAVLKLTLTADDNKPWADEIIVELGHAPGMTGAKKMFSKRVDVPQLYAVQDKQAYSMLFLESAVKPYHLDLRILPGSSVSHNLAVSHGSGIPVRVQLEDPITGTVHLLSKGEPFQLAAPLEKNQELKLRLHLHP